MALANNEPLVQVSLGLAGGIVAVAAAAYFYVHITSISLPTKDSDREELEQLARDCTDGGEPIGTADDFQRWFRRVSTLQTDIHGGAKSFLFSEYRYLLLFCIVVFAALCGVLYQEDAQTAGVLTGICFLVGAFLSGLAGYIGMVIATEANSRTAYNCVKSMKAGLEVSFASGAVMSNSVVGFGVLGVAILYLIFSGDSRAWQYLSGFGFGASSIALFARVGGGIFTKAADVGADLVGKVDSGIPEDDPRNPATIADNVGDNVGDVAGMGADLFESFVGGIIATATLAASSFDNEAQVKAAVALPFWIAGVGIIIALVGTAIVRTCPIRNDAGLDRLLRQINYGIFTSAFLVIIAAVLVCGGLFGYDQEISYRLFGCVIIGLASGLVIGQFTEFCTSYETFPTRSISESAKFGTAPVIIMGLGVGMISVTVPTIALSVTVLACNALAGLYGISVSSVGLLATLGITLATDAYGPVADNAGGIAEMAGMHDSIRTRTDALDSLGNTTAATGKGFAIGSAVLTAVGLIAAFLRQSGIAGNSNLAASLEKPVVLTGVLIGAMLPFVFAALTMLSVNKAAQAIIAEVRRQFSACPDLLRFSDDDEAIYEKHTGRDGLKYPDSDRCVAIATSSAVAEMVLPGVAAVFAPVVVGFLLGTLGLAGLLVGALTSGFMLALTMSNAGGAWDNAKKWVEKCAKEGEHGEAKAFTKYGIKKESVFDKAFDASSDASVLNFSPIAHTAAEANKVAAHLKTPFAASGLRDELVELYHNRHSAVVNGDTVGDPFKDTSGPALNILIKLMSVISLVLAPAFANLNEHNGFGTTGTVIAVVTFIVVAIISVIFVSRVNAANKREEDELETKLNQQKLTTWVKEAEARATALDTVDAEASAEPIKAAVDAITEAAVPALVEGVAGVTAVDADGNEASAAESNKLRLAILPSILPSIESKLGLQLGEDARNAVLDAAKAKIAGEEKSGADSGDGDDAAAAAAAAGGDDDAADGGDGDDSAAPEATTDAAAVDVST